jgi:hypothetical protein
MLIGGLPSRGFPDRAFPDRGFPGYAPVSGDEFRSRGQPGTVIMFPTWKELKRREEEELVILLAASMLDL